MSKKRGKGRRKKLRVLLLVHEDLMAPEDLALLTEEQIFERKTEIDVIDALTEMGHEVHQLGISEELKPIRDTLLLWKPHIVFNMIEEFQDKAVFDQHIVGFLEMMRVPYTGCNPRGLVLTRDKALSKKLLAYHRIPVPQFTVARMGRRPKLPKNMTFPVIVKSLMEEASMGISKASVVHDNEKLAERVAFVHERIRTDAIVEQFISGREIYVGVLGNQQLTVLPAQELLLTKSPGEVLIATEKLKHDQEYQAKHGLKLERAKLDPEQLKYLERTAKRIYKTLCLEGYGRIDFRLGEDGKFYCLEANPNPDIADTEEFASAALDAGISYNELLQKILNLGLRRFAGAQLE